MGRFYFHVYNRIGLTRDEEGSELPDLAAAREKARDGIRSILSEEVRHGSLDLRGRLEIANAASEVLAVVPFREAIELHLEGEST
jgi:hypothetical protein